MSPRWRFGRRLKSPSSGKATQAVDHSTVQGDLIQASGNTVYVQTIKVTPGATYPVTQDGTRILPRPGFSFGSPPVESSFLYGREKELRQLRDLAVRKNDKTVLLYGAGGVGKTALAARFWRDYESAATKVWLDASSSSSVSTSVLDFAKMISGYDFDYATARDVVRTFLAGASDSLVILDNAPNLFVIDKFGLSDTDGLVLITSRHALNIPNSRERINVQPLEKSSRLTWCRKSLSGTEAALELLADRLSGFPLIAERIIDLFSSAGYSADQMLETLDRDPSITDSRLFLGESARRQFETLYRTDLFASGILLLTALGGQGSLPSGAVVKLMGERRAVELFSSIRLSGLSGEVSTAVTVHDEIAASLKIVTPAHVMAEVSRALISALSSAAPLDPSNPEHWSVLAGRSEFARRLGALTIDDRELQERRAELMLSDLSYLRHRGLVDVYYDVSRIFAEIVPEIYTIPAYAHRLRSLNLRDDLAGITSELTRPEVISYKASENMEVRQAIAQGYWKLGKYEEASNIAQLNQANCTGPVAIVERIQLLDLAARIERVRGQYETALQYLEDARLLADADAPHLAGPIAAVEGVVMLDLGRLVDADQLLTHALSQQEETLGVNHPRIALVCNNLGIVKQDRGYLNEAWALYQRAITINTTIYGSSDERVAANLMNMANILVDLGRHDEAITFIEHSIRIRQTKAASKRTWALGIAFHNLGYAHFCGGRYDWATNLFQTAYQLKIQSLPEEDPRAISSWCGIVRCRMRSGRPWSYRPEIFAVLHQVIRHHPENKVITGLLWTALAESFYLDDKHPAYRSCAFRANFDLGGWGGFSTDRVWIARLGA